MKSKYIYSLLVMILCSTCFVAIAQTKKKDAQTVETLKDYFIGFDQCPDLTARFY